MHIHSAHAAPGTHGTRRAIIIKQQLDQRSPLHQSGSLGMSRCLWLGVSATNDSLGSGCIHRLQIKKPCSARDGATLPNRACQPPDVSKFCQKRDSIDMPLDPAPMSPPQLLARAIGGQARQPQYSASTPNENRGPHKKITQNSTVDFSSPSLLLRYIYSSH
jgi:hypothetical protein